MYTSISLTYIEVKCGFSYFKIIHEQFMVWSQLARIMMDKDTWQNTTFFKLSNPKICFQQNIFEHHFWRKDPRGGLWPQRGSSVPLEKGPSKKRKIIFPQNWKKFYFMNFVSKAPLRKTFFLVNKQRWKVKAEKRKSVIA